MNIAEMQVTLLDHSGSDLSVVNAARVSFDKESALEIVPGDTPWADKAVLSSKDEKLISYLARHKHTSPFNHAFASFRVKAPIFVARQLVKHKFLPWNEVSRRYVDSEPEFFFPLVWRAKADNVKQGSSEYQVEESWKAVNWSRRASEEALWAYNTMLDHGVCPEQARMVLPLNAMTEWIWSGTLGAWSDMCKLRLDDHSQRETQIVAEQISKHMSDLFPVSWPALMEA